MRSLKILSLIFVFSITNFSLAAEAGKKRKISLTDAANPKAKRVEDWEICVKISEYSRWWHHLYKYGRVKFSKNFPGVIKKGNSVISLNLWNRKIEPSKLKEVAILFSELRSLRYINLSLNDLEGPIPSNFIACTQLETLDLSFNDKISPEHKFFFKVIMRKNLPNCAVVFDEETDPQNLLLKVSENGLELASASKELKANKDSVLAAVNQNGLALRYASVDLRDDLDVVSAAVSRNGLALRYASEEMRDLFTVVEMAVSQNGLALQFASEELRDDDTIVSTAICQNPLAHKYVLN